MITKQNRKPSHQINHTRPVTPAEDLLEVEDVQGIEEVLEVVEEEGHSQ